jgi:hypothetical protein
MYCCLVGQFSKKIVPSVGIDPFHEDSRSQIDQHLCWQEVVQLGLTHSYSCPNQKDPDVQRFEGGRVRAGDAENACQAEGRFEGDGSSVSVGAEAPADGADHHAGEDGG